MAVSYADSSCTRLPFVRIIVAMECRAYWIVALFLIACHGTDRSNPVDPELTPPVQLQAAVDDINGTSKLTWTRYEGRQPFREYRVLRNVANTTAVDTLIAIPEPTRTTYSDSSIAANTDYEYRIGVVNSNGFEAVSDAARVDGFVVNAVTLVDALGFIRQ